MPTQSTSADNLEKFNASGTPIVKGDTVILKNRSGGHMTSGGRGQTIAVKVEEVDDTLGLKVRYRRTDGGPLDTVWFKPEGVDRVGDQNNSNDCVWTGEHTNCRHTAVMPVGRLAAIDTREEAHSYLAGTGMTKPQLLELARTLQVDVGSRDNMKTIRRKIVAATVGVREDAEAIRATTLSSRQSVPTGVPTLPDADPPAEDSKLGTPPQRWPHGDSGIVPANSWHGDPLYHDQQVIPSGLDRACTFPGCTGRFQPVPGTDHWDADGTASIDTRCNGHHPDGKACNRQSTATWYWPEDQPPSEDPVWTSQNEQDPPVRVASGAVVLPPLLARNRYTDEEWKQANSGRCGWVIDYRRSGPVFCNTPVDPRSQYRFCQEHDEDLADKVPAARDLVVVCPRCGEHSQPGQPLGPHCYFTACGHCGEVGGPDKMQFSFCRRCGANDEHLYDIDETAIPKFRQQIYDAKDAFQYTNCEYCGQDLNRHVAAPDPIGNVSLICLDEPDPDGHTLDQVAPTPTAGQASTTLVPQTDVDSPETLLAALRAIAARAEENRWCALEYSERAANDCGDLETLLSNMVRRRFTADDCDLVSILRDPSQTLRDSSKAALAAAEKLHTTAGTAMKMAERHVNMQQRGAAGAFYQ